MSRRDLTGALDVAVLERFTQGDIGLMDEVLGLFQEQVRLWAPMLEPDAEGWADAVHTLKGSAAGVGATRLAAACAAAEGADETVLAGRLDTIRTALIPVLSDTAAYRHELALRSLKGG